MPPLKTPAAVDAAVRDRASLPLLGSSDVQGTGADAVRPQAGEHESKVHR